MSGWSPFNVWMILFLICCIIDERKKCTLFRDWYKTGKGSNAKYNDSSVHKLFVFTANCLIYYQLQAISQMAVYNFMSMIFVTVYRFKCNSSSKYRLANYTIFEYSKINSIQFESRKCYLSQLLEPNRLWSTSGCRIVASIPKPVNATSARVVRNCSRAILFVLFNKIRTY